MRLELLSAVLCFVATASGGCPLGCYWFSNVKGSFPEAAAYCRYLESHPVVVSNAKEDSFIRGYAIRRGKAPFYRLGATDLNIEGRWMWEGQRRMNYTHWPPGQPDNSGGAEHCLEIAKAAGNYHWNDRRCDKILHFICEKEP